MTSRQAVIAEMADRRPLDQTAAIVQVFGDPASAVHTRGVGYFAVGARLLKSTSDAAAR
jgi:hypothetical protein